MISTSEIRITTIIAEDALETAVRALHAAFELERPEAIEASSAAGRTEVTGPNLDSCRRPPGAARSRRLDERRRPRLAGGRRGAGGLPRRRRRADGGPRPGRPDLDGAAGAGLLLVSSGFRPTWLAPDRVWQLAGAVSLAMADAAEEVAGPAGPRDPPEVAERPGRSRRRRPGREARRSASWPASSARPTASGPTTRGSIVGIGINADWPAAEFPPELAGDDDVVAASVRRPADRHRPSCFDGFLGRLESGVEALRAGRFDAADWLDRQLTTGRLVDGSTAGRTWRDRPARWASTPDSGALRIAERRWPPTGERLVFSGEIRHVRLAGDAPV